jgi:hypothetical protein
MISVGTLSQVILVLLAVLGSFFGAYFGAYGKKKGENLATHEDIDKLVDQVKAVTKATKEIETKISDEVWDKQKRWQLKKEVLFEAARRLAEVDDALLAYSVTLKVDQKPDDLGWVASTHERRVRWSKAAAAFDETRLFVSIVCGNDTRKAFDEFGVLANQIAAEISRKDATAYDNAKANLFAKLHSARIAARKELEIENP